MNINIGYSQLFLLKVAAIIFMTLDHVNKYIYNYGIPEFYYIGRLALPLFVLILAYNLSKLDYNQLLKVALRLLVFGAISIIPYNLLGSPISMGWWPLNVFFTLASISLIACLLSFSSKGRIKDLFRALAFVVFLVSGVVVEYFWPAIGFGVAAFTYFRLAKIPVPNWKKSILLILAAVMLYGICSINGNYYALLALPLFFGASKIKITVNLRWKWFFYWFYPVHLCLIWWLL